MPWDIESPRATHNGPLPARAWLLSSAHRSA